MTERRGFRSAIATCSLLMVPLVMTVVDRNKPEGEGFHWGLFDFVAMGTILFIAGFTYELVALKMTRT